jgi:endoglucanase Acf2
MDNTSAQPLVGLYPHHQQKLTNNAPSAIGTLPSVRGPIQLVSTDHFETEIQFNGLMPFWPSLENADDRSALEDLLVGDKRRAASMFGKMGNGTYWTGKALGAVAQLMNIAEQHGDKSIADDLESLLKQKIEIWLSGKGQSYFAHDPSIGSVLGYPEEYFSVSAMNDHHFHYGYWIMAAAHLARRDPNWASVSEWGGMINLLVRDIATAQRKRVDFPFLRNFDVYEGHSWARGNSDFFGLGNDQESSSEALHAWAAIALWGQQTGQKDLEDLGVYLYATESVSVLNYWFNVNGQVFHPDYKKPAASMVFGGGYGFSTWWTEEPRQIMGINFLPITPGSTYLARLSNAHIEAYMTFAEAARADYDKSGQSDGTSKDIWQDIYASVMALKNPQGAIERWNPRGSTELGDTRTRTFFWLHYLKDKGVPDLTITANTISYAVFHNKSAGKRTYVAYNPGPLAREIKFSDGITLMVPPRATRTVTKVP